jgi:hypothetical protein
MSSDANNLVAVRSPMIAFWPCHPSVRVHRDRHLLWVSQGLSETRSDIPPCRGHYNPMSRSVDNTTSVDKPLRERCTNRHVRLSHVRRTATSRRTPQILMNPSRCSEAPTHDSSWGCGVDFSYTSFRSSGIKGGNRGKLGM